MFSTCGFHDNKFSIIKRAIEEIRTIGFPEDKIIMLGCLPKTHEQDLKNIFKGKIINFKQEDLLDQEKMQRFLFQAILTI